jgi:hypothetical protein
LPELWGKNGGGGVTQEKIDGIRERMCDEYCGVIGNNSLSIYARKEACDNCPLNELEASE